MKCPSCGRNISRNSQFCNYCGNITSREETLVYNGNVSQLQKPYQKTPRKKWIFRILSLILALGFITVSIGISGKLYFQKTTNESFKSQFAAESSYVASSSEEEKLANRMFSDMMNGLFRYNLIDAALPSIIALLEPGFYVPDPSSSFSYNAAYEAALKRAKDKITLAISLDPEKEKQVQEMEKKLSLILKNVGRENGIKYLFLEIGANYTIFLIIGVGLIIISLLLWIILGGIASGTKNFLVFSSLIAIVISVLIVIIIVLISPIDLNDLLKKTGELTNELGIFSFTE